MSGCSDIKTAMSVRKILQSFDAWRGQGEPLVLATVFETLGSTYTKPGHRILIAASGDYRGLVSGGCLEGDLAERARNVVAGAAPAAVTYDLRDATDELWGLGVGCNGLLRVFLQPLGPATAYEPFAAIARCLVGSQPGGVATVIERGEGFLQPGATAVVCGAKHETFGDAGQAAASLLTGARRTAEDGIARFASELGSRILYAPLRPIPKLLVLGAGLDAVPLVGMAAELGWFVTVADHRPGYLARSDLDRADRTVLLEPEQLAATLPLAEFDAIVVMSHHLATDRKYLQQLQSNGSRYLGVLGPREPAPRPGRARHRGQLSGGDCVVDSGGDSVGARRASIAGGPVSAFSSSCRGGCRRTS